MQIALGKGSEKCRGFVIEGLGLDETLETPKQIDGLEIRALVFRFRAILEMHWIPSTDSSDRRHIEAVTT